MVGNGDFQRGIDGFRTGIREEHAVHAGGRDGRETARQFESHRMTHLKSRGELHGIELPSHRIRDLRSTMSGVHTPQAGDTIQHFATILGPVVHALGASEQSRIGLELPVSRERHPECVEIGGRRYGVELCVHVDVLAVYDECFGRGLDG
jgi:hypothetical protein